MMPATSVTCQEHSSKSVGAWVDAYRRGCLYKSVDKDVHYSHAKALSGWQFGRSTLFPEPEAYPGDVGQIPLEGGEDGGIDVFDLADADKRYQPLIPSPVILEDLTRPPAGIEDAEPALFTIHEFLAYLSSPEWQSNVRLRVVGGELLRLLNASLVSLEKRRRVNLHTTRANANSRVPRAGTGEQEAGGCDRKATEQAKDGESSSVNKSTVRFNKQAENTLDQSSKNSPTYKEARAEADATKDGEATESTTPRWPKAYQTDPKWEYETLGLEMIFYEKAEKSNIPYMISDISHRDYFEGFPAPKVLPRSLTREPYSQKAFQIDNVRLPSHENLDLKKRIESLEAEMVELTNRIQEQAEEEKNKILQAKDIKGKEPVNPQDEQPRKSGNMDIPDVEFIATDPHLEREKPVEENHPSSANKTMSDKHISRAGKTHMTPKMSQMSAVSVDNGPASKIQSVASIHEPPPEIKPEATPITLQSKDASVVSLDRTLMNVSGSDSGTSCSDDDNSWEVLDDFDDDSPEEQTSQKLELTRTELYVSSLYAPREENRRAAAEKLEIERQARARQRALLAKQSLASAVQRARGDLYSSFKHLTRQREAERIRATRPNVKQTRFRRFAQPGSSTFSPSKSGQSDNVSGRLTPGEQRKAAQSYHLKGMSHTGADLPTPTLTRSYRKPLPNISRQPEPASTSPNPQSVPQQWERYRKEEDNCEMESALRNDLERRLLDRMPTLNLFPNYKRGPDEPKVKAKTEKNRSQNKKSDENTNRPPGNTASDRDKVLLRKYPAYNLFLSLYGRTVKITQPELKDKIIESSFCPQWRQEQRIGFKSPEQLIDYLVSVRNTLHGSGPRASWVAAKPEKSQARAEAGKRPRRRLARLPHDDNGKTCGSARCDANNSSLGKDAHRHSRAALITNILEASGDQIKLGQSGLNSIRLGANVNASAASDTRVSEAHSSTFRGDLEMENVLDAVTGSEEEEAGGEGEGEEEEDGFRHTLALTISEILEQDLLCYGQACTCEECQGQSEFLAHLRPNRQVFTQAVGCPPSLGRLRRDYNFLKSGRSQGQEARNSLESSGRVKLPERLPVFDVIQIGDQLLNIMDDVMIRKEILSSSRDLVYITITFTKRKSKDAVAYDKDKSENGRGF